MQTLKDFLFSVIMCYLFILLGVNASCGQENKIPNPKTVQPKITFGPEYIWPSNTLHTIHTTSFNILFNKQYFKNAKLNMDFGLTATYARGTIIDWYSYTPPFIYHKTSAFGAGPVIHIQKEVFIKGRFSIEADASGGLILYNKRFPFGGDVYNFMFRGGGLLVYRMNDKFSIQAGYKWMHVSNGKGLGAFNPTYEGTGISVTLTRYFFREKRGFEN